jgi:uncharacterized protein
LTEPTEPGDPDAPAPPASPSPRPGARIFTVEGRAAPGLYLVGWLATVLGLAILAIALLTGSGVAGTILEIVGLAALSVGLVAAAGSQGLERRAAARAGYDGPSPFLTFAATIPVTAVIVLLVALPAVRLGLDPRSPPADLLSLVITAAVYLGLIRLLVVGPGALTWDEMGLARRDLVDALSDLGWGAGFAIPLVLVTLVIGGIFVSFLPTPDSPLPVVHGAGFIVNLVSAAVVAPIGEELYFRGFATTAWARVMPARRAILRGALFFALVHVLTVGGSSFDDALGRAFVAFATRIPIAVALGWVFIRRRSLYASIGLHATFNGALLVLAELAARG